MGYIEREALFKTVEDYASTHPVMRDSELFALFCSVPAADVRPVVRGAWRGIGKTGRIFVCSACDKTFPYKTSYCPNCGADMRAEEGET